MKNAYPIISGVLILAMACTATAWGPHTIELKNEGTKDITTAFQPVAGEGITTNDINISTIPSLSGKLAAGAREEYKFNFQPTDENSVLNFALLAEQIDLDHVGEGKTCLFSITTQPAINDEHAIPQDYRVDVVGSNCSYQVANDKLTLIISEN